MAVPLPIERTLSYTLPETLCETPKWGTRVLVPVGQRPIVGLVWGTVSKAPPFELRGVLQLFDKEPLLPPNFAPLLEWVARYYLYPLGQVVAEALPPGFLPARSRRVAEIARNSWRIPRRPLAMESWRGGGPPPALNPEQEKVLGPVRDAIASRSFRPFLLHGVTGSGKTEVYLQAAEACLKQGRCVLVLVPEISMTTQAVGWFIGRFGDAVTILHSGLTEAERRQQWWRIRKGLSQIVVGTRSAIFAPFPDLGLIVVDEEHDPSYKQEEKLRYQARDLAVMRTSLEGAVTLLGSATPSLSSYRNAVTGRYGLLRLQNRVEGRRLPEIRIVDSRDERITRRRQGNMSQGAKTADPPWLSHELRLAMEETLGKGEQILLFLNRRGFATYLFCSACGHVFRCPSCAISLTLHRETKKEGKSGAAKLLCHYCGFERPALPLCPNCKGKAVRATGWGTERVAADVQRLFPEATVARLDRDTVRKRRFAATILRSVYSGEVDILVGTQMITKGHDFPGVTLVGVLWADISLNFPEYQAPERTFQLLAQVAGRAGRGDAPGGVIVQTRMPEHYALRCAQAHDYAAFFRTEAALRQPLGYPPFGHLINLRLSGPCEERVASAATALAEVARRLATQNPGRKGSSVEILGPAQAPRAKLRNRYRWQLLLKGTSASTVHRFFRRLVAAGSGNIPPGVRLEVDVDPQSLL